MNKIIIKNLLQYATLDYNLKYLFFNFNKRKNMSCPDLGSSSTKTPNNTNLDFKHKNICPDFLVVSCQSNTNTNQSPAKTQTQTQQQIFSDFLKPQNPDIQNLNSNPDFLIFQSTTKPPANKIYKPRKFSIKTPFKKKKHKLQSPHLQTQAKSFLSSFSIFVWLPRK